MKNRFVVTEEEKKNILSLYETFKPINVIKEQNVSPTNTGLKEIDVVKFPLLGAFGKGVYEFNDKSASAVQFKTLLQNYLNNPGNKGATINVGLISGESLTTPPKGMKVGDLARLRAESVQNFIKNSFPTIKFIFTKPIIKIGTKPYRQGVDNPDDPKYLLEQFVDVTATATYLGCDVIEKFKTKVPGSQTQEHKIMGKTKLSITPGTIPDRMILKDVSGNIISDTNFFGETPAYLGAGVTHDPRWVLSLSKIYKQGNHPSMVGNKIQPIKVKSPQEVFNKLGIPLTNQGRPDVKKFNMEAVDGIFDFFKNGGDLFLYEIATTKLVEADLGNTIGRTVVFSPVSTQTNFEVGCIE